MSFFDVFQIDDDRVQQCLDELRLRYPEADLDAWVEDDVVMVRGEVGSSDERLAVLEAFRNINPDLTPVAGGGLKKRALPPGEARPTGPSTMSKLQRAQLSSKTTKRIYRVQPGESLRDIAVRFYQDERAVLFLVAANGDLLERPGQVQAGWILEIPESFRYTVRAGDTLATLAERFYHDPSLGGFLAQVNLDVLMEPERLEVGRRLFIPFRAEK